MNSPNLPRPKNSVYTRYIKRVLDIFLSLIAIIILSPVYIIIYILELVYHGTPAIYKTQRPGLNCKLFCLYKFRSMTNKRDQNGDLLPEEDRLTKFGYFLRRFSLDELPELINILRGDMSIIGPRPLLTEYLPLYTERHMLRHCVRPGLACVRIHEKESDNSWTWAEQFENDIYYIEHMSFLLDVKMVLAVLKAAVKGSEERSLANRVTFNSENLYEKRSRSEIEKDTEV